MRLTVATVLVAILAAAAASLATGDSLVVQHERFPVVSTSTDASSCAFPITVTSTGNIDDALFFDSSGNLVRILETVSQVRFTFSANGHTLTGIGSGGIEIVFNADGSVTANTFGINLRVTVPGGGAVILDTGRATFLFNPHINVLFHAGPANYDLAAFCSALAP